MPTPQLPRPIALRIELLDVTPMVWRRVLVSNQWTLASLHGYLQWVMGWTDSHAHEFEVGNAVVGPDWWLQEIRTDSVETVYRDERRVSVARVLAEVGPHGEFEYRYDMGDGWRHRLVFEPVPAYWASADLPLPACVAGENACPPEDVGGPPGYQHLLGVLADRNHEEHTDMLLWVGGVFDPGGFDLNRLNRDYKRAKGRRR